MLKFLRIIFISIILLSIKLLCLADVKIDCGLAPTLPNSMCTKRPNPACAPEPYTGLYLGTISRQGKAFVTSNNNKRFVVRGVGLDAPLDAPNEPVDPLSDANAANFINNVLPQLKTLGVNLIRVFDIDPTQSHNRIMNLLQASGIYVTAEVFSARIAGAGDNLTYINSINPNYTTQLYTHITQVVDALQKYNNLFSFEIGNEVIFPGVIFNTINIQNGGTCNNKSSTTICAIRTAELEKFNAAITKNIMRDVKSYMKTKGYRNILLGTAMQDTSQYVVTQADVFPHNLFGNDLISQFYACGDYTNNGADYIGINSYAYTPNGSLNAYDQYAGSLNGWGGTVNSPIPYFLTEAGANDGGINTRTWAIKPVFYNMHPVIQPDNSTVYLQNVLSGETAFEFFAENAPTYYGLFSPVSSITMPIDETWCGGAEYLTCQNRSPLALSDVPFPTNNPTTIDCPTAKNFSNAPSDFNITVTLDNSVNQAGVILVAISKKAQSYQNGAQLQHIAAKTKLTNIQISSDNDLIVLTDNGQYHAVCTIPAARLLNNTVISTATNFGNNPCPISFL